MNTIIKHGFTSFFLIITIGLILGFSRGFDLTDESFYLLNAEYYSEIFASTSFFGFFVNVLFQISFQNLLILRTWGLILLILSSFFFFTRLSKISQISFPSTLVSSCLTATLSFYLLWLPTPSYNMLTLASIFFIAGSLINILIRPTSLFLLLNSLNVGFWGFIIFSCKPSSAIIMAIIALLTVLKINKVRSKILFTITSSTFSFLLLTLLIFDIKGSYSNYLYTLNESLKMSPLPNQNTPLWTQSLIFLDYFHKFPATVLIAGVLIYSAFNFSRNNFYRGLYNSMYYLIIILLLVFSLKHALKVFSYSTLWTFWYYCSCTTALLLTVTRIKNKVPFPILPLSLWTGLLLLNFAFSFGTNNNLHHHQSLAATFTFSSCLILCDQLPAIYRNIHLRHLFFLMIIISTSQSLLHGLAKPYRQNVALWAQHHKTSLMFHNMKISVSAERARYINNIKDLLLEHSWHKKTLLLDMTGTSPGLNLILDAKIPRAAWLLGGYKNSSELVDAILKINTPSEIQASWIVTSPKHKRALPNTVLIKNNIILTKTHTLIGKVFNPYQNVYSYFWKPI